MYAVYILFCADNSYYTGLTNDLEKRLWQHETGYFPKCYTFKRRPIKLVWQSRIKTSEEADNTNVIYKICQYFMNLTVVNWPTCADTSVWYQTNSQMRRSRYWTILFVQSI